MWSEILDTFISIIVDGLEDFFSVLVYPTRRYIKTAIIIALGFLVFSLCGLWLGFVVFVDWYEVVTCIIMLLVIYGASFITQAGVNSTLSTFKKKAKQLKNTAKSSIKKGVKHDNK